MGLLLAIVTQPGLSLRCYTCNSKDDISCWNLTSSRDIPVKVSECPKEGMDCMQKIDKNHDKLVVFRECSHRTFPDKWNDDQDSCHWYCNTDLCNHGLMGEMPNSAAT